MPNKTEQMTFETALVRLGEILQALEGGDADLDTMLKLYEEGVGLIRFCNERLENAEQRVKMLQLQPDGKIALQEISGKEED